MADDATASNARGARRRTLLWVLLLNTGLAGGLLAAGLWADGLWADSGALVANALDNGSEAAVYAISYFAVARSRRWKAAAAIAFGVLLIVLSLGVVGTSSAGSARARSRSARR